MTAKQDQYATYKLLTKEFLARGYTVEENELGPFQTVLFTSPKKHVWLTPINRISYPLGTSFIMKISTNKALAYEFAEKNNIPIPDTYCIGKGETLDVIRATSMLKSYTAVIVKPENASLSNGLSLNITKIGDLHGAIERARAFSERVLVQQQVKGEEIRFVLIDGKVRAAILRETARVVGDGIKTTQQLIQQENKARELLVFPYISYPQLTAEIVDETYLLDMSVLLKNEVKILNKSTMIRGGASIYNIIDRIDESYIHIVEKLASRLGAGFIAVDMFVEDYAAPMDSMNAHFIEFNTAPVLKLFYGCRDGKMFDVIPELVSYIDRRIHAYET